VDALSSSAGAAATAQAAATALLLAGGARAVSGIARELQGPMFAPVAQVGKVVGKGKETVSLKTWQQAAGSLARTRWLHPPTVLAAPGFTHLKS
jgi:hypothetical protein